MLCCCSTYHVKVMKSGAALFSGSFASLRGKDGIRNQFVLFFEVRFTLSVLVLLRAPYGRWFPAYERTRTSVLHVEIQVLSSINLGKFSEVWIWSLWLVLISCKLECEWAVWHVRSFVIRGWRNCICMVKYLWSYLWLASFTSGPWLPSGNGRRENRREIWNGSAETKEQRQDISFPCSSQSE